MAVYRVIVKPSAERALQRLPLEAQRRIVAKLAELAVEPRPANVVKLVGDENLWRIRVGVYRVVYEIKEREILVYALTIGHRREVYRGL
ncbi:MAG: type II toxin-antitoxin system RelE/ParE family toxin [Phycisphaerales bacterium]|nr:type II toxin-antitoxin system RelE/ParE family toxin [Phycisphaerales bacterium]